MTPFIPHCAYCGRPLRDCGGVCDGERDALMRAVCDAMALVNVSAPVITPGVGGPLVPPGPTPFAPQSPLPPREKFGGIYICSICRMEESFCGCAKQRAPEAQSQDAARADASLEKRVKECRGRT